MQNNTYHLDEPYLLHELILGMAMAIGMLIMAISETLGVTIVSVAAISVLGIYLIRLYAKIREGGSFAYCCFNWMNNGVMILAVVAIILMIILSDISRPVFISGMVIIIAAMLVNGVLIFNNIRGTVHIMAQVRLMIAMVVLIVFFLL